MPTLLQSDCPVYFIKYNTNNLGLKLKLLTRVCRIDADISPNPNFTAATASLHMISMVIFELLSF